MTDGGMKTAAEMVDEIMRGMRRTAEGVEVATAEVEKLAAMIEPGGRVQAAGPPAVPKALAEPAAPASPTVLRPNGEAYHIRELLPGHTDVSVLRNCRKNGMPVMLYGPPGTGKTALIEAAFCEDGGKVYTIQCSGDTEFMDFIGSYVQLPGGEFEWVDGPLVLAMEEGVPLYVDEIALTDPKALAGLYGVMDGRGEIRVTANPERGVVKAKDGFYVVAACNPHAPGARMSEALVSRFLTQFEVTTDYTLARKLGVPAKAVTAAQNLARKQSSGETSWAPQLRELLAFRKASKVFGEEFAARNMVAIAPELDRPVVADVLTRALGTPVSPLKL